jgi:hypothetical protein
LRRAKKQKADSIFIVARFIWTIREISKQPLVHSTVLQQLPPDLLRQFNDSPTFMNRRGERTNSSLPFAGYTA